GDSHAFGETLRGVELTQPANAIGGVRQAGAGEAPGADRGANERPFARGTGKPLAKQCQIQPLDADTFGTACGARKDTDIGRFQSLLANSAQRSWPRF